MKNFLNRIRNNFIIFATYKNSYRYFLSKLGVEPKSDVVTYKLFNGMNYRCRSHSSDFAILNENILYKEYQRFFFPKLSSGSLVLDFGAQAGSFSVSTAYKYGAKVFSFEPEESNFRLLCENISLNQLDDLVIPVNKAISISGSRNYLYKSPHANQGVHSMVYYDQCDYEKVDIDSLDPFEVKKLIDGRTIDFLKMDIEGSEHPLIDSDYKEFWDLVDCVAFEYHCHPYITEKKPLDTLIAGIGNLGFNKVDFVGDQTIGLIYAAR